MGLPDRKTETKLSKPTTVENVLLAELGGIEHIHLSKGIKETAKMLSSIGITAEELVGLKCTDSGCQDPECLSKNLWQREVNIGRLSLAIKVSEYSGVPSFIIKGDGLWYSWVKFPEFEFMSSGVGSRSWDSRWGDEFNRLRQNSINYARTILGKSLVSSKHGDIPGTPAERFVADRLGNSLDLRFVGPLVSVIQQLGYNINDIDNAKWAHLAKEGSIMFSEQAQEPYGDTNNAHASVLVGENESGEQNIAIEITQTEDSYKRYDLVRIDIVGNEVVTSLQSHNSIYIGRVSRYSFDSRDLQSFNWAYAQTLLRYQEFVARLPEMV